MKVYDSVDDYLQGRPSRRERSKAIADGQVLSFDHTTKTCYLAGPMSNQPDNNVTAFAEATRNLRARGYQVTSPHELDQNEGLDPTRDLSKDEYAHVLLRDLKEVANVDAVVCLPEWTTSPGARAEVAFAHSLGKQILVYPDLKPIHLPMTPITGEQRITNERTGGAKGRKSERYDLLPYPALDEVARVYHHGSQKYDDWNWLKGFDWSLSIGAAGRHMAAFASGEDHDEESGLLHPAHAAFHMLALTTFASSDRYRDLDDRPDYWGKPIDWNECPCGCDQPMDHPDYARDHGDNA